MANTICSPARSGAAKIDKKYLSDSPLLSFDPGTLHQYVDDFIWAMWRISPDCETRVVLNGVSRHLHDMLAISYMRGATDQLEALGHANRLIKPGDTETGEK